MKSNEGGERRRRVTSFTKPDHIRPCGGQGHGKEFILCSQIKKKGASCRVWSRNDMK